jgi:hypothetical protein
MRRALLFAAALVLFTCTSAFADGGSVNYTGNVTFLSDPGFSFSFSEPGTLTSLDTTTTLTITQGATNLVLPNSEVEFWDTTNLGLFDLDFTYLGTFYDVQLFGAQIYSQSGSSFNLLTGKFPVTGGFIFLNDDPIPVDMVTGGKVTAAAVGAPEPEGLAMLGLGIAALLMLRKKQLGGAAV